MRGMQKLKTRHLRTLHAAARPDYRYGLPPIREKGASCVSKVAHEEKAPAESQRGGHFLVRRVVASIEVVIWRRGEYE